MSEQQFSWVLFLIIACGWTIPILFLLWKNWKRADDDKVKEQK